MKMEILGQQLAHRLIITMLLAESRFDLNVMHHGLINTLQLTAQNEIADEEQTLIRYTEAAFAELDGVFSDAAQWRSQTPL